MATGFQDIDWVFQGFNLDLGSLDLEIGFSTVNGFFWILQDTIYIVYEIAFGTVDLYT